MQYSKIFIFLLVRLYGALMQNSIVYIKFLAPFICICLLGGHDGLTIFASVERYDPESQQWNYVASLSDRRCRLGATATAGYLFRYKYQVTTINIALSIIIII